ncbi:unnamed protein product [Gordionus sp. m RMFG-2023]
MPRTKKNSSAERKSKCSVKIGPFGTGATAPPHSTSSLLPLPSILSLPSTSHATLPEEVATGNGSQAPSRGAVQQPPWLAKVNEFLRLLRHKLFSPDDTIRTRALT